MTALFLAVAALAGAVQAPEAARPPSAASAPAGSGGGVVNLSLIDALAAVQQPQVNGLFAFIAEKDSSLAFADLLARDRRALKRYLAKLRADRKAAGGLTPWDRDVCAALVNLYASPLAAGFDQPGADRLAQISECVLAPPVSLEAIVTGRKR